MVIKSRWSIPIPQVSLPTFIFGNPGDELADTAAFISAQEPEKHRLSIKDYRLYAQRLASGLLRSGFQPGERILLFSGNTLFFPSVIMGIIMAGGVFTGANPTYVTRELAYQLNDSGAKYLFCAEGSLETGLAAAKEVGMSADRIFVFDSGVGTFSGQTVERDSPQGKIRHWTTLLDTVENGQSYAWPDLRSNEELDRVVALNYSSGTTGVAKGVMITHRNYVANCTQTIHMSQQHRDYHQRIKRWKALCFLPMYHAMAQAIFCVNAPKQRIPVYMMPRFDFLEMLQCVQKFKITSLLLVPPVVVAMAKQPVVKKFDLSSVEDTGSGAAPLGLEASRQFESLWPDGRMALKQGWGMTELTCAGTSAHPHMPSGSSSVGELLANCEARIVADDEGLVELPQGESGEIWIRAPNVMKGYWNRPEATRETITPGGWLKTGDVAFVDKDNQIHIVDRKKELIKVKGLQVAPAELEALLLDHPDVQDVAVIGVTTDDEELPRAYIVPQSPEKATAEVGIDIKKWLAERVSKAKRLEGGVHFLEMIPKNPSGKILRKQLREMAAKEKPKAKL
ncbi:4-coumarate-CoA ligase-like protein [Lophiostoma macrostomum CBS 122681]|uniref:4-coumarate-CoA ligase-like protein n=1 Tax=Lophiostoma macrostomum CBS 122681 TaxID=1314788 RepID=A0A6A6SYI8_9PLEO|nr:4-coumarate-CoA ligase-like protein [Lophiostoma macrostomum CBS 122681]